jgi:hypothetical protein
MLPLLIVCFGIVVLILSYGIAKKMEGSEKSELATYIALTAWGSLMIGFVIARISI